MSRCCETPTLRACATAADHSNMQLLAVDWVVIGITVVICFLPALSLGRRAGRSTTDFFASILVAKTVQRVRVVGNIGLGILADPTRGDQQNDVLTYGLSFARALTQQAEVVGEVNGRVSTRSGGPLPGTESRGIARVGARYTIGGWRADAAVLFGVTSTDPTIGFAAGFTYVFNAFQIP